MNILDKIIARKKEEIAFSKSKISVEELKNSEFLSSLIEILLFEKAISSFFLAIILSKIVIIFSLADFTD